jgi:hypothetical protein
MEVGVLFDRHENLVCLRLIYHHWQALLRFAFSSPLALDSEV